MHNKTPTILPWHREAAHRLHGHIYTAGHADRDDLATIIARHDPNADATIAATVVRDAERYRYLRSRWDDWTGTTWSGNRYQIASQLDAAIDAAQRQPKGTQ